jgi:hypothetical protein
MGVVFPISLVASSLHWGLQAQSPDFFMVSRVWGNVPRGMVFGFVNKNNLL